MAAGVRIFRRCRCACGVFGKEKRVQIRFVLSFQTDHRRPPNDIDLDKVSHSILCVGPWIDAVRGNPGPYKEAYTRALSIQHKFNSWFSRGSGKRPPILSPYSPFGKAEEEVVDEYEPEIKISVVDQGGRVQAEYSLGEEEGVYPSIEPVRMGSFWRHVATLYGLPVRSSPPSSTMTITTTTRKKTND